MQKEQEKLTLTELQRYLPLQPPTTPTQFPENVKRYLGSSSFNNYSLKEQAKIKADFKVAYRNYYSIADIVEHLAGVTKDAFTRESIEQAICNSAEKYELIDWFLFVRIVTGRRKPMRRPTKEEAVSRIIAKYMIYLGKKRVLNGRNEV